MMFFGKLFVGLLAFGQSFLHVTSEAVEETDGTVVLVTTTPTNEITATSSSSMSLGPFVLAESSDSTHSADLQPTASASSSSISRTIFETASHPHKTTILSSTPSTLEPLTTAKQSTGLLLSTQIQPSVSTSSIQDQLGTSWSTPTQGSSSVNTIPPDPDPAGSTSAVAPIPVTITSITLSTTEIINGGPPTVIISISTSVVPPSPPSTTSSLDSLSLTDVSTWSTTTEQSSDTILITLTETQTNNGEVTVILSTYTSSIPLGPQSTGSLEASTSFPSPLEATPSLTVIVSTVAPTSNGVATIPSSTSVSPIDPSSPLSTTSLPPWGISRPSGSLAPMPTSAPLLSLPQPLISSSFTGPSTASSASADPSLSFFGSKRPPSSSGMTSSLSTTTHFLFPSPPPGFPPGFESSITSTITALPPGASIQILPAGAYTQNTIITTTSPGSSTPTIVPVIVLPGGLPEICWGCIFSLPGFLEINIPQFCIDILGFQIGFCPWGTPGQGGGTGSSEGGSDGDGGGGGGDGDGDIKPTDEPTSQQIESTSSTSSSSSSSCTTTVTATYESIFCYVTTTVSSASDAATSWLIGRQDTSVSTECSTLAYSTITGCSSATGSTTTSSSTTTVLPETVCDREDACGKDQCAGESPSTLVKPVYVAPPRDTQPGLNQWAGPEHYGGNAARFFRGEVKLAYDSPETSIDLGLRVVEPAGRARGTYNYVAFENKVESLALKGLYGCTSVFVVSRKGAWMSHFWQGPSFSQNAPNSQRFMTDVLDPLNIGYQPRQRFLNLYTLRDLRNNDNLRWPGDTLGHIFDDQNLPQIWVFTPKRVNPDGSDPTLTGSPPELQYEEHIDRMEELLYSIFPVIPGSTSVRIRVEDYMPLRNTADNMDWDYNYTRGKILIQYQPAPTACDSGGNSKAKYRVWLEGSVAVQDEWEAGPEQQAPAAGPQGAEAGRDLCPVHSSSASASGATSISSIPLSASESASESSAMTLSPTSQIIITVTPTSTEIVTIGPSIATGQETAIPDQKSSTPTTKSMAASVVTVPSVIVTVTVPSVTVTAPASSPTPECNDQCKLNRGNRCRCDSQGCDAESPACCATGSCPKCSCDWPDLEGSAKCNMACCTSSTCEWATTGGHGGMWCNFNFHQSVSVRDDDAFDHPFIDWEVYPWRGVHPQTGVTPLGWNKPINIFFAPEMGMNSSMEVWLSPDNPKPTRDGFEQNLEDWALQLRTGDLIQVLQTGTNQARKPRMAENSNSLGCNPTAFWTKHGDGTWDRGYNCYFPCSGESW